MIKGIIIFGASGSGTTSLGKALAQQLNCKHFDIDDYYWLNTYVPFTVVRPIKERIELLLADIAKCNYFVMSGNMGSSWSELFVPLFDLAVFNFTPTEVRINRIRAREIERFGDRILEGGDMYEEHEKFIDWASRYDTGNVASGRTLKKQTEWASILPCPVLRVDGSKEISYNVSEIIKHLKG